MSKITRDIAVLGRYAAAYRSEKLTPYGLKAGHTPYLTRIAMHPGVITETVVMSGSELERFVLGLGKSLHYFDF